MIGLLGFCLLLQVEAATPEATPEPSPSPAPTVTVTVTATPEREPVELPERKKPKVEIGGRVFVRDTFQKREDVAGKTGNWTGEMSWRARASPPITARTICASRSKPSSPAIRK